eukprot:CAMPEP_0171538482 /NCGR_PEP_ID=MMETSP0960-20121227/62_1 /TAXON_ID=87120 /ORGANISM="Aurantiochytrium limacinum, Strain ATCCMYA-1381" /LENGTH=837 /DNA_ID=CAMNT_0012085369 /DNA_START=546 /DNA_END=3059 /DNA_ORIENTATION=-
MSAASPARASTPLGSMSTTGSEVFADGKSKSERIQELVHQMKMGNITKSELFTQLSLLQRTSSTGTKNRGAPDDASHGVSVVSEEEEHESGSEVQSSVAESPYDFILHRSGAEGRGSTPERRAQILQRLFEEKRRQRQKAATPSVGTSASVASGSSHMRPDTPSTLESADVHHGNVAAYSPRSARPSSATSWVPWEGADDGNNIHHSHTTQDDAHQVLERMRRQHEHHQGGSQSAGGDGQRPRPSSAPRPVGRRPDLSQRGSASYWYETRKRRMQQDLLEKQLEECTFRPKIRDLPSEYGTGRHPRVRGNFQERVDTWNQRKREETERKRREKQASELDGCTFQPQINRSRSRSRGRPMTPGRNSDAGSSIGSPISARRADEDVYGDEDGLRETMSEAGASRHGRSNPYERLYRQNNAEKIAAMQAKARADEEERMRQECTFKPKLSDSVQFPGRSRYMKGTASQPASARGTRGVGEVMSESGVSTPSSRARRKSAWDEQCTFTPQTNPVHPKMEAAQVYLSNDIFTRLSQPREALYQRREADSGSEVSPGSGDDDRVMDMETFMASLGDAQGDANSSKGGKQRPGSAPRQRPSTAEGAKALTAEERRERRKSFEAFLARQSHSTVRKQQKIAQVAQRTNPSHKPELCAKSLSMANQRAKGDFLQRVAKGAIRREHEAVRRKSSSLDPECTFHPKITRVGQSRPARTTLEMSRGDSLRKETNTRLMKLRVEQEELQDLTFTPEFQARHKAAEGRLKILSEPDTYIRRLQHKDTLQSHKQTKAAQDQEMKELEECTFKPEIHDAPAYVKRIVRSLALAKPAREAQAAAEKEHARPEWR